MTSKEDYILWLPSWYPSKLQPYNGDFIQRHAHAASLCNKILVVFLVRDEKGAVTKDVLIERKEKDNLLEVTAYYYSPKYKIKSFEKLASLKKYFLLYKSLVAKIILENGEPDLIHVYVTMKAGILGWWLSKKYNIPYLVSEQWTIYLPEARPNYYALPFVFRIWIRNIFLNAQSVMVVSHYLRKHIKARFRVKDLVVIPNVVNLEVFNYKEQNYRRSNRFIHVSTLNYQKNTEAILNAIYHAKIKGCKINIDVIGPVRPKLIKLVSDLSLADQVLFHTEMPQSKLVHLMQGADALILFSRYETFGCVLIESHACGVPVIVSDIPVMHENVIRDFNGVFAKNEDPELLAEKMMFLVKNNDLFDKNEIASYAAAKYNYQIIGKQLHEWYGKFRIKRSLD